jgi:Rha family phage regulatory protein
MTNLIPSPSVSIVNGRPSVNSLQVSEHFGKNHQHVLRDIRRIASEVPEDFHQSNFGQVVETIDRPDGTRIDIPAFVLFRDGFMLLVMSYTGKKALQIKLAYIAAFNAMEAELAGNAQEALPTTTTPSTTDDRKPLRSLVNAWAQVSGMHHTALWPQVRAHFLIERIDLLPLEWIPDALAFVQGKIDEAGKQRTLPEEKQAALPAPKPIVTLEEQAAPHFAAMRGHVRAFRECQRAMYDTVRRASQPALNRVFTPEHTLFANTFYGLDKLFYSMDYMLEATETHVKTLCAMCRR